MHIFDRVYVGVHCIHFTCESRTIQILLEAMHARMNDVDIRLGMLLLLHLVAFFAQIVATSREKGM